jgi:CHAT domain-containing protein
VHLGALATEAELQQLNARGELRQYRWLLFSTHGYVSPTQPALSAIVLGLRDRAPGTDGYVTAAEWPGYDLRSDLVVLSACDTGVGPVLAGEGVMGLPFALQVAGNVSTILTLWPVDDRATAGFVSRLFARLKGGDTPTHALAETKREFARGKRWAHPSFWAPFILVGAG